MFTRTVTLIAALLLITMAPAPARAQQDPEPGVAVTVYNQGYGVVKDDRHVEIPETESVLRITDVAKRIDATSVYFKSLTDPDGTTVLEQNYEYDLVSADKLLEKYLDRSLTVWTNAGKMEGHLLSFDKSQLVIRTAEGIRMVQREGNVRDIQFGKLPKGLLTRPTLVWTVGARQTGRHLVRMAYQTSGMQWRADYNVVTNADDTKLDVGGWVTVTNNSGTTYENARLKLIAGDVRRVVERPDMVKARRRVEYLAMDAGAAQPEEKAFFEYHLYTFPRRTTLRDNQVKQLQLLQAADVGVEKVYLYEGSRQTWYGGAHTGAGFSNTGNKKVKVILEVDNTEGNNLGKPLPAGKVRVFKRDEADGSLEFVGEDRIDHTKVTDTLELYVGNAFDLGGERTITDFEVRNNRNWMREDVKIELTSAKDEAVTVRVREGLSRARNWTIRQNSDDFQKEDAHTVLFNVTVPPRQGDEPGKKVITYTVEYTW